MLLNNLIFNYRVYYLFVILPYIQTDTTATA